VARSCTTSDVFNAVADAHRRAVLDALIIGEKAVGEIVSDLSMSQPQVSKHLRVLSEVGLVSCRADGRRRLYRLEPARLRPLRDWLAGYEQAWNERMDRMDDYLRELQRQPGGSEGPGRTLAPGASAPRVAPPPHVRVDGVADRYPRLSPTPTTASIEVDGVADRSRPGSMA